MVNNYKMVASRVVSKAKNIRKYVILLAVFVISIFQLGSMKALGVFIPSFVDQLDMRETEAGLSCGIGIAVARILGALWGVITSATSSRFVTILGGLLCAIGFFCMSIAPSHLFLHASMAIMSVGLGLPMVAKVLILSDYFEENFNTANSIGFAGGAFGMIVLAPTCEFLISRFGWRSALMILSAVSLNIYVAGLVMKPLNHKTVPPEDDKNGGLPQSKKCTKDVTKTCSNKTQIGLKGYSQDRRPSQRDKETNAENVSIKNRSTDDQDSADKSYGTVNKQSKNKRSKKPCCGSVLEKLGIVTLTREPKLGLYLAAFALQEVAVTGWMLFLFTYTILLGYEKQIATVFSSIGGFGTLFGRLLAGPCTDKGLCSPRALIGLFAFGGCFCLLLYPFVSDYWSLLVLSLLTGLFVGTTSPMYVTLLKDMFADNSMDFSGSVSLHFTLRGIGMLCGGPLTGWIHETTGTFYVAFYTLAGFEAVGAFLIMITPFRTAK